MNKYLVITPGYPKDNNVYNNFFVHSRVLQYKNSNLDMVVFSLNKEENKDYTYQGVKVIQGDYKRLKSVLLKTNFNKILIHFAFKKTMKTVIKYSPTSKLLIWVHGVEALGWYRRIFIFDIKKPHRFLGYIFLNFRQMMFMNRFIRNKSIDKTFIFVSEWMKNIIEKDSFSKNKIKQYEIIPNVVDTKKFNYKPKTENQRLKILSIRPYASKKYANDLSVKAILELSKKPFFSDLTFSFYGDGKLFDKTLKPLKKFSNVKIHKKFLSHEEISKLHKENGIMLIPTRQDAQGVSMCEAMSSGLVAISSNNTAIPEFVKDNFGYLTNNYIEIANSIVDLYNNSYKFLEMSRKSSRYIQTKCSEKTVIEKELYLILK